ncbi:MAG: DUF1343 domain-containing protein, partial [Planctomycetes bacterium]|nr:DUF1343 domain-containing protein [Planctomycetota bacterium]
EGPVCTLPRDKLTTYYSAPVRHGMTAGELAQLANARYGIGCRLTVVKAQGWQRAMWFDETGLPWVNPSPNLRNLKQAILYPCICCLESSNVSVGRGTDMPFELFGAPWMDSLRLAAELNALALPGLSFTPIGFTPKSSKFQGERCGGVYVMLNDREAFQPVAAAARIIGVLWRLRGPTFDLDATGRMFGTPEAPKLIRRDPSASEAIRQWEEESRRFSRQRRSCLLYP